MQDQVKSAEFSRLVDVAGLAPTGEQCKLTTSQHERAAVAGRLQLVGVHQLSADISFQPWRGSGWTVAGTATAEIEQQCVLTAENFRTTSTLEFERRYLQDANDADSSAEIVLDPLSDDDPDPIMDGRIDLADLIVEELALSLDPYPRMPGAQFEAAGHGDEDDVGAPVSTPFAVLAKLQRPD